MQKKGKERGPSWFGNGFWLTILTILAVSVYWAVQREPTSVSLKLGELKHVLQDPGVVFQNVRLIGRSEMRGEILTRDPQTGGENPESVQTVQWRASIREFDPNLQDLLDKYVGAGYSVDDEEGGLRGVGSFLVSMLFVVTLAAMAFLAVRWMVGGQSPLNFGRSRHRLHAD